MKRPFDSETREIDFLQWAGVIAWFGVWIVLFTFGVGIWYAFIIGIASGLVVDVLVVRRYEKMTKKTQVAALAGVIAWFGVWSILFTFGVGIGYGLIFGIASGLVVSILVFRLNHNS
ncbi:MAG: hypothetical protein ABR887_02200 [Methanoregulaceae archaeon]|jgi:hypothetical protein